jgi:glycosyltransferase involved in cell wall biosynthesis
VPAAIVICPVLPWPPTGGAEKRTLRLLEAMERAGATPHLLSPDGSDPVAAQALRERGWTVELAADPPPTLGRRAGQHLSRRPSPYVDDIADRLRALRTAGPAFVQIEHTMAGYYFASHPPGPVALSTHNVDSEMLATVARAQRPLTPGWVRTWNRALEMRTAERRTAKRADAVLVVSEHDAEAFERLGAKTIIAPNGVDDELFEVAEALPDDETVLFFGRLDYAPNDHGLLRLLHEVWPRITRERPRARLRVVGAGLRGDAAAAVAAAERAEAAGVVPDIAAELAAAAVVIVPLWQGGGTRLKVLEALAAARPVAATALGVAGIGVRAGEHALVADDDHGLAEAAVRLLSDRGEARRLAVAGRGLAQRFRWSATTAPAQELYERWLA